MASHWIICLSCVHRSLKLLKDSIFVPPALFHGFGTMSALEAFFCDDALCKLTFTFTSNGRMQTSATEARLCNCASLLSNYRQVLFLLTRDNVHRSLTKCQLNTVPTDQETQGIEEVTNKSHVLSDCATVDVLHGSSYFGLHFYYLFIFQWIMLAYKHIYGDGAD